MRGLACRQGQRCSFAPRFDALVVTAAFALLGAACGPAPYVSSAEDVTPEHEEAGEPVSIVYITLPEPSEAAPPAAVAVEPAPVASEPEDEWVPDAFPVPNPFGRTLTWIGDYDCTQGTTGLALRIIDVRGRVVRAIFDFHHAPSGAAGQYLMMGTFDGPTRKATFAPGAWLKHPPDYIAVGMEGKVSPDGSLFAGQIPFPGCGEFRLRAAR